MTMKHLNRSLIEDALSAVNLFEGEDGDAHIRDEYSGRGMYGRSCFGVTFGRDRDSRKFLAALALTVAAADEDEGEENAYDLAESAETDSMGRGMILYFPGWTLN